MEQEKGRARLGSSSSSNTNLTEAQIQQYRKIQQSCHEIQLAVSSLLSGSAANDESGYKRSAANDESGYKRSAANDESGYKRSAANDESGYKSVLSDKSCQESGSKQNVDENGSGKLANAMQGKENVYGCTMDVICDMYDQVDNMDEGKTREDVNCSYDDDIFPPGDDSYFFSSIRSSTPKKQLEEPIEDKQSKVQVHSLQSIVKSGKECSDTKDVVESNVQLEEGEYTDSDVEASQANDHLMNSSHDDSKISKAVQVVSNLSNIISEMKKTTHFKNTKLHNANANKKYKASVVKFEQSNESESINLTFKEGVKFPRSEEEPIKKLSDFLNKSPSGLKRRLQERLSFETNQQLKKKTTVVSLKQPSKQNQTKNKNDKWKQSNQARKHADHERRGGHREQIDGATSKKSVFSRLGDSKKK